MDISIAQYLPEDFSHTSRVWIYQSSRRLTMSEALQLEPLLENFVANWQTHGTPVKGYANLLFGQFIVLMADETAAAVSGCSTDSSVRLIKEIETIFNLQLFNRQMLAFVVKDKIETLPLQQLQYAVNNGFITADTLYFNNTVTNKAALLSQWIAPLKQSWLAQKIKFNEETNPA
jgi:hypothetical protein